MECTNPVTVTLNRSRLGKVVDKFQEDRVMKVPCGHCMACRIQRNREWAVRCYHEATEHESNVFVTLTYSDDHLPADGSLSMREFQLFIKRLRKNIQPQKIKYYGCGEYGDERGRPHYHALLFGCSRGQKDDIESAWPFGRVYVGTVTFDSCRYVTGYIQKKYGGALGDSVYEGKVQPFQCCSQGIGLSWAIKNDEYLRSNLLVTVKGNPVGLPRYYVKKLELDISARNDELNDKTRGESDAKYEKYEWQVLWDADKKTRKQRDLNIRSKASLKPRKDF